MALKIQKTETSSYSLLVNPDKTSLPRSKPSNIRLKSPPGFNLNRKVLSKVPKPQDPSLFLFQEFEGPSLSSIKESFIRKYYGKKILFIKKAKNATSALHHSKLFTCVNIENTFISENQFKVKGGFVILDTELQFLKYKLGYNHFRGSYEKYRVRGDKIHPLIYKKFVKYCPQVHQMTAKPVFLKHIPHLKHLSLQIEAQEDLVSLGKILARLPHLRSINLQFIDQVDVLRSSTFAPKIPIDYSNQNLGLLNLDPQQIPCKFFTRLHKLPRLKSVLLVTSYRTIFTQFPHFEKDLKAFYSKKPRKFIFHVKIFSNCRISSKNPQCFAEILSSAECICLDFGLQMPNFAKRNPFPCNNESSSVISSQEKNKLMLGKKNIAEILTLYDCGKMNLKTILSYCNSMQSLYIKSSANEITWETIQESRRNPSPPAEIKGFKTLQNVFLDFNFFKLDFETQHPQKSDQTRSEDYEKPKIYPLTSTRVSDNVTTKLNLLSLCPPLLVVLRQLREKCPALQGISLALCIAKFDENLEQYQGATLAISHRARRERLEEVIQEISTCEKVKRFELCVKDNLGLISLKKIFGNKNLERFGLKFCCSVDEKADTPKSKIFEWDANFAGLEVLSQIKELHVNIPTIIKTPLYGVNFINFIGKLESLQVIELVDENRKNLTLDFLYGLLMKLFEKKTIRKIKICSSFVNELFSQYNNMLFSKNVNSLVQQAFDNIFLDIETGIKALQNLEEVMIGRLKGYQADFIFYNQQAKSACGDKIFWTEKEIKEFFCHEKAFEKEY